MRRAAKIDDNQPEIIEFLEKSGFKVASLAAVGDGMPDIMFSKHSQNHLAEIKDGKKSPSRRRLTPDQERFHANWQGKIYIFETLDDVSLAISEIQSKLRMSRGNSGTM